MAESADAKPRSIGRGDIYWARVEKPGGSGVSISHPHVVIHDEAMGQSCLGIVVVCALTSNLKRINELGNVLLDAGEANLARQSVVVVSQVSSVEKTSLGEYIGSLSERRIEQILDGMRFQQASFFSR